MPDWALKRILRFQSPCSRLLHSAGSFFQRGKINPGDPYFWDKAFAQGSRSPGSKMRSRSGSEKWPLGCMGPRWLRAGACHPVGWLSLTELCWVTKAVTALTQQTRAPLNQPCSSGFFQPQALMTQQRAGGWLKGSPNVRKTYFGEEIWFPVCSKNREMFSWKRPSLNGLHFCPPRAGRLPPQGSCFVISSAWKALLPEIEGLASPPS